MRTATVGSAPITYLRDLPTSGLARRVAIAGLATLAGMTFLVLQTSLVASSGYGVEQLTKLKASQERQIQDLDAEVAALRSLDRIEAEARGRLKMITPSKYIYVTVDALPSKPSPLLQKRLNSENRPSSQQRQPWWETIPLVRNFFRSNS